MIRYDVKSAGIDHSILHYRRRERIDYTSHKCKQEVDGTSRHKTDRTANFCRTDEVIQSMPLDDLNGTEFERLFEIYPIQNVREHVAVKSIHNSILTLLVMSSNLTVPAKKETKRFRLEYLHGGGLVKPKGETLIATRLVKKYFKQTKAF